ncbi:MAG TPA: hypothetical protein VKG78_03300 [Opitutaceae bacterium]|nr:hypothetical protein [Opitutaceae bacterium]
MESIARILLLFLAVILFLRLASGGWTGVKQWINAKYATKLK